uniref:Phosphoribosyltransferase domain-containing protein n=1 Tax=Noctiluca scintillans TaxID=2966 RepID=A0A7S1F9E6_NOCSC|mmetsp:Transcript_4221/g.11923  ORF Transcript_4221/g.11923 Transcript_4221/m.11923 type:complete len:329 (+) Transcript_4221:65-1051(+)
MAELFHDSNQAAWIVFYHESMKSTAQELVECMDGTAILSELEWLAFNDGFPNLQVKKEDAGDLRKYHGTCFILSFHDPQVIFEQMALLYSLPRMGASNLRVILPWFCTGTMERVETVGQIATAKSLARMISATPISPSGPPTIVIYDIHALQEQFYFSDNVLVELKTAVWLLKIAIRKLQEEFPSDGISIAFPDDGAHKRFKSKFAGFNLIVCNKVRDGDARVVKVAEGDPSGKHVIIVDDLVQSGSTLLECAKPLKQMGASKVSCFVTHGVFPKETYKRFFNNDLIHKFWITDSVPTTCAAVRGKAPFEVLSLAPIIATYLKDGSQE